MVLKVETFVLERKVRMGENGKTTPVSTPHPSDVERTKTLLCPIFLSMLIETWTYTDLAKFVVKYVEKTGSKNTDIFLEILMTICPSMRSYFSDLEGLKKQIEELQKQQSQVA